jgi:hypothetical protein
MQNLVSSLGKLTLQNLPGTKSLAPRLNLSHALSTSSCQNSLFGGPCQTVGENRTGILCPSRAWESPNVVLGNVGVSSSSSFLTQMQVRFRRVYITRSRRFPGHVDVYGEEDGTREPLKAAEERFKRLDWGIYIRTRCKSLMSWDSNCLHV